MPHTIKLNTKFVDSVQRDWENEQAVWEKIMGLKPRKPKEDKTPEILDAFWAMVDKFQKKWGVDLKINLEEVLLVKKVRK